MFEKQTIQLPRFVRYLGLLCTHRWSRTVYAFISMPDVMNNLLSMSLR